MLKNIKCKVEELFGGADFDIDFNQIAIFVGKNGTGKTMVLKLAWLGTYITSNKVLAERGLIPSNTINEEFVTKVTETTFDDPIFNGSITFTFEDNVITNLIYENGKCINISFTNVTEKSKVTDIVFMSSEMRLFTEIVKYLKLRKRLNGGNITLSHEIIEEMLEDYKLYDFLTIERVLALCPLTIPEEVGKTLVENYDFKDRPTEFIVDLANTKFFLKYSDGTQEDVLRLGSGHQAILNMFVVNLTASNK